MTDDRTRKRGSGMDRRTFVGGACLLGAAAALPEAASATPKSDRHATRIQLPPARAGALKPPQDFMWGVSTAGHQIEGNNVNSDVWLLENIKPTMFAERSGDACDSYHRYAEDIALIKALGLNAYRFSIEWSRIEPSPGAFSVAELDHYKKVIDACHRAGIRPAVTFNHYSNPIWFAASGAWLRPDAADIFARYCDVAAHHLADGMSMAFTFNEPQGIRLMRWLPGAEATQVLQLRSAMAAAAAKAAGSDQFVSFITCDLDRVLEPMIAAHKKAYAAIKSARPSLPVGVTLAILDYQAQGPNSRVEEVQRDVDGAWLEAAKTGDFVGVQNYSRMLVDVNGPVPPSPGVEGLSDIGLEFYPAGLGHAVRHIHNLTSMPIVVSENGIGTADDARRIRYIDGALPSLGQAMADGVPVLGYFHWSLLDNFEWFKGYSAHFGLVAFNRETFARTPKPSSHHYAAIVQRNLI